MPKVPRTTRPRSQWGSPKDFLSQNADAAKIIGSDVEKHGGEGSGLVQWARTFLDRDRLDANPNQNDFFTEVAV